MNIKELVGQTSQKNEAEEKSRLASARKIERVINELIDTSWAGSNASQMKAVQLLKGIATSDDPKANAFMKQVDKAMSGMKK